jgi:hypothetical protein
MELANRKRRYSDGIEDEAETTREAGIPDRRTKSGSL